MANHYYDAGSGPHDAGSKVNERGERNCGCQHDGLRWISWCRTAWEHWRDIHEAAAIAHRATLEDK